MTQRKHSIQTHHDFQNSTPKFRRYHQGSATDHVADIEANLTELYLGLACYNNTRTEISIGFAVNDGTYGVDFAIHKLSLDPESSPNEQQQAIEDHVVSSISKYCRDHKYKMLGAGVTTELDQASPRLCPRLWLELDIVPMLFKTTIETNGENVDELADSAARKCLSKYGPNKQPRIAITFLSEVDVDMGGQIRLTTKADYQRSVREPTWRAVEKLAKRAIEQDIRVAFFSATPQGGGVALMRHALVRFLRVMGVHVQWYVPRPRPDIFRITKTNHNILQGVVGPDTRASDEQLQKIQDWITDNADHYWIKDKGPLLPASKGGASVIIVDDPQMPELIPIAKKQDPDRPVLFRSHIEVRDDLVQKDGSAAQQVWKSLWEGIKSADMFISHPVKSFVPSDIPPANIAWLPATTDWLDGLNKEMNDWDLKYYLHMLKQVCSSHGFQPIAYPERPYITQIARFDPSKGIPDVLESYAKFRAMIGSDEGSPQLVICGHASIDDPDGTRIFDETMTSINEQYSKYKDDIFVLRLGPSDQLLNAIMSMSKIALQLSTREGFEVKVSEALHKGIPIVATNVGGIPLQIEDGKSGFLVSRGDCDAVAKHLHELTTDKDLYAKMSSYAKDHVSDEVHTVGNALSWLYLITTLAAGKKVEPNGQWINDLAREAASEPYQEDEPKLPRHLST